MNRSKTRIFIGGMTCVNCQNKIETALLHTAGIEIARVSYQNGTADLVYDPDWITLEEIQQVIRDAGYEVLSEKARNKQKPGRAAHILIVIAVLDGAPRKFGYSEPAGAKPGGGHPNGIWDAVCDRSFNFGTLYCHVRRNQPVTVYPAETDGDRKRSIDFGAGASL